MCHSCAPHKLVVEISCITFRRMSVEIRMVQPLLFKPNTKQWIQPTTMERITSRSNDNGLRP